MLQKKLKVKDINLLDVYKKKKEPSKYASVMKYAIPPMVLALAVFGVYGYITMQNITLQNDIDEMGVTIKQLEKKIAEDPNLGKVTTLKTIVSDTEKYKKLYEDIQSYPQLTQWIFDQLVISGDGRITITGFDFSRQSQSIMISIETPTESDTEQFVRNLKASGEFAKVTYAGYASSEKSNEEETTSTSNALSGLLGNTTEKEDPIETVYVASIECVLK